MFRIYYDSETGDIKKIMNIEVVIDDPNPHIDVQERINMNEWKVDINSKGLIPIDYVEEHIFGFKLPTGDDLIALNFGDE